MTTTTQEKTLAEVLAEITMPSAKGVFAAIIGGVANRRHSGNSRAAVLSIYNFCRLCCPMSFSGYTAGT